MSIQTLQLVALNPKPPRAFPDYFFLPCALSTVPRAQMRWIMNTESSKSQSPDPGVLMKALSNQQFGSFQGKRGRTWYCDCNFYIGFYPMEIKKNNNNKIARVLLSRENQHLNQSAQKQNQITELRVWLHQKLWIHLYKTQVHTPDSLHLAGICMVISFQTAAPLGENQKSI